LSNGTHQEFLTYARRSAVLEIAIKLTTKNADGHSNIEARPQDLDDPAIEIQASIAMCTKVSSIPGSSIEEPVENPGPDWKLNDNAKVGGAVAPLLSTQSDCSSSQCRIECSANSLQKRSW